MRLVHLAGELGQTLKTLVRVPLLGGLLRTMRAPAHAAGFGALQEFLETGFNTFKQIPDIDLFLEQLVGRLDEVFQDFALGDVVVSLEWDIWFGCIAVAKNSVAEGLIQESARFVASQSVLD